MKYLNKNERMVYQEKQHRLEVMLKGFKELYEKEKVVNIRISQKLDELVAMYDRVLIENETILKSN